MASLFRMRPAVEPEGFDECPVLLAHPASDRWMTVAASRPFYDRLCVDKDLVLLKNCGHFPVEEPGVDELELRTLAFLGRVAGRATVG